MTVWELGEEEDTRIDGVGVPNRGTRRSGVSGPQSHRVRGLGQNPEGRGGSIEDQVGDGTSFDLPRTHSLGTRTGGY